MYSVPGKQPGWCTGVYMKGNGKTVNILLDLLIVDIDTVRRTQYMEKVTTITASLLKAHTDTYEYSLLYLGVPNSAEDNILKSPFQFILSS